MVKEVLESKDFLKSIAKASRIKRKSLLNRATSTQLRAIQQITNNINKNVIPLTPCQIRKLIKGGYRPHLVNAGKKRKGVNKLKRVLLKHGGFLPFIIPAALSYLISHGFKI